METPVVNLELTLQRQRQGKTGTSGDLSYLLRGIWQFICHTIELPWKDNQRKISCVIAGRYEVTRVDSPAHGICLEMQGIPGRGDCQFHKANWATGKPGKKPELQGCVAPVTTLDALPGVGWASAEALAKLEAICFPVIDKGGRVFVTIIDVVPPVPTPPVVATTGAKTVTTV